MRWRSEQWARCRDLKGGTGKMWGRGQRERKGKGKGKGKGKRVVMCVCVCIGACPCAYLVALFWEIWKAETIVCR
jgi:hypothetical protein